MMQFWELFQSFSKLTTGFLSFDGPKRRRDCNLIRKTEKLSCAIERLRYCEFSSSNWFSIILFSIYLARLSFSFVRSQWSLQDPWVFWNIIANLKKLFELFGSFWFILAQHLRWNFRRSKFRLKRHHEFPCKSRKNMHFGGKHLS